MEPTKVLQFISSLEIGGSQSFITNIYSEIDTSKVQFDFIIDHPGFITLGPFVKEKGAEIYEMPTFKGYNLVYIIYKWIYFFYKHPEYKILHSHVRSYAVIILLIANLFGLTTIIHGHSTSNGSGFISIVKKILQFPLRYIADWFFACSIESGVWLFGNKVANSKKYKTIPNSINSERFKYSIHKRDEIRKKLNIGDEFVIGNVGRFESPKNHMFLLDIFKKCLEYNTNILLLLVGDGSLKNIIKEKTFELGIQDRVIFAGNQLNIEDYYCAMDVFVFPSKWEGFGMSVIEAQSTGLKCVVSNNVPKTVDIKAGLIRFLDLRDSIKEWCNNTLDNKKRAREDCYKFIINSGFDLKSNIKYLEEFYQKCK